MALGYSLWPCMGSWPYIIQGLIGVHVFYYHQRPWCCPGVWSATQDHNGIQGSCCHWAHIDLGGLSFYLEHGDDWAQAVAKGRVLLHGSMFLFQPGSVLMYVTHVMMRGGGNRNHVCCNSRVVLSWPYPSLFVGLPVFSPWWTLHQEICPYPTWESCLPSPVLTCSGELALLLTLDTGELTLMSWASFCSLGKGNSPSSLHWLAQLSPRPKYWVLCLPTLTITPSFAFWAMRTGKWNVSHWISMT